MVGRSMNEEQIVDEPKSRCGLGRLKSEGAIDLVGAMGWERGKK